jgi:hypothetical protein
MEAGTVYITVALAALFAAAVFQPRRIQSAAACWVAVAFAAGALVLPGVALLIAGAGTTADGGRRPEPRAGLGDLVQTVQVVAAVDQLLLAGSLIATAVALFPRPQTRPATEEEPATPGAPTDITTLPKFPGS